MSEHIVSEAEARLSELIDRALAGEGIVITREGRPAVAMRAVDRPGRPVMEDDLAWLAQRRAGVRCPAQNAGELMSGLRDDDRR